MKQLMKNKITLRCFQCENPVNRVVFSIIIHSICRSIFIARYFHNLRKVKQANSPGDALTIDVEVDFSVQLKMLILGGKISKCD